jgi:ribonuclease P protein component
LIRIYPLSGEKGLDREAHVPTEDTSSRARAWISRAHEDHGRSQGAVEAPRAWPQAHHRRLIQRQVMRAARLRRSGDIKTLRAEGRSLRRPSFSARVRRTGLSATRLAVIAPGNVGRAVARNRARRRVREAFRIALQGRSSNVGNIGVDIMVTARPEALHTEFIALRDDAANVLSETTS